MTEQKPEKRNEVNILDAILVLARGKWVIVSLVLTLTIISLVVSFLWPVTYKSTAKFLPPVEQRSIGGGLGGLVGSVMQLSFGSEQIKSEAMLIVLTSRSLKEEMIRKFNLAEVYGTEVMEHTLKALDSNTQIREIREGGFGFSSIVAVELSVTDKDPHRAFEMTTFYLEKLDSTVIEINRINALESFDVIENRYLANLSEMELAENKLRDFQTQYGIIEVEEQAKALIENLGELKSQSIELEIQIAVLRQSVDPSNPELRQLERAKNEVDQIYDRYLRRTEAEAVTSDMFHPLFDLPDLGIRYMRLYRDVIVQNKVYENMYPQYIHQKMILEDKRRSIQIIEEANIPTYKESPKRAFIVIAGFLFGLILSLIIVFWRHMMEKGKEENSETYYKVNQIREALRIKS
jgi:tyrosine-protein kinase Etk/Wzc